MVKLFAYGTLRPGGSLERSLLSAYSGEPLHATAHGQLFHHVGGDNMNPIYPVADFTIMDGSIIHGDILTLDDEDWNVERTFRMEQNAGYQLIQTEVTLDNGLTETVYAFHFPYSQRGPRIEDGDWMPFERMELYR
jgi:gamma-glutamylcyclotransferase (GGCT)/AIG2-like uncharacterized protein YtfP